MKAFRSAACLLAALAAGPAAWAQRQENLDRWPYYKEIEVPAAAPEALFSVLLDAEALSGSREDHADLRVYDAAESEVPYMLRVLRDEVRTEAFAAREFNRSARRGAAQVFLDLGRDAPLHNQVEIDTAGHNFRRRVEIHGSDDRRRWSTLTERSFIYRFESSRGSVYENRVRYPDCRYRFLRIVVHADPEFDAGPPAIEDAAVRRTVERAGETLFFPARVLGREATRHEGRAASAYRLELEGRLPLGGLLLHVSEGAFSRPYVLETAGSGRQTVLASGQLVRRESRGPAELKITFEERFARRLRLTVIDDRNPPLTVAAVTAQSAARELIFRAKDAAAGPLRLYYGNRKAAEPHYDFADSLGWRRPETRRLRLGRERENPEYRPEPKPLTERSPWLIYVVLAAASAGLFLLLRGLAREAADRPNGR